MVVLAGHSYMRRLSWDHQHGVVKHNFGLDQYALKFVARNGAKTMSFLKDPSIITSVNPKVVILQIGGNDFSGRPPRDHIHVADDIFTLATRVGQHPSVQHVIIGKLFHRAINPTYLPTQDQVDLYNHRVDEINDQLKAQQTPNISLRHHKGMTTMAKDILGEDGTQLNHIGTRKLVQSLRGALIGIHNPSKFPSGG